MKKFIGITSKPIAFSLEFVQNDSNMKGGLADTPPKFKVCKDANGKFGGRLIASREQFIANSGEGYRLSDGVKSGKESAKKNTISAIIEDKAQAALF